MVKHKKPGVALFGGSFDPPHLGHLEVAKEAQKVLNVDKIIVMPAWRNPFKSGTLADAKTRLKWCRENFGGLEGVEVSDLEVRMKKAMPTIETIEALSSDYDVTHLIIGADNLKTLGNWHRFDELNRRITWVIAEREGIKSVPRWLNRVILLSVDVPVSSTMLREAGAIDRWLHPKVKASFEALWREHKEDSNERMDR